MQSAFAVCPSDLLLVALIAAGGACTSAGKPGEAAPAASSTTAPQAAAPPTGAAFELNSQDRFRMPDKLIAALGLHEGDAVAEVGSGAGYLTPRLARAVGAVGRVVATDIEPGFLETLKSRVRKEGLGNVTTRLVPSDEPRLEPATYDLIFLAQVDHLLLDRAAYLGKLTAALKPGGRIAISNRDRWKEGLLAAVRPLPFRLVEDPIQLPGQFLIFLTPAGAHP